MTYHNPDSAPESLCILRLSAIGDVTHVLPSLRAIQKHWPNCRITWIIGKTEAALVSDIPGVTFIPFDKRAGWRGYLECWRKLRGERFDVLLHMQISLRASLLSCLIRARVRLGFDRKRAKNGQWLFSNRKISPSPQQHVLEGFLGFPEKLGVPIDKQQLTWDIPIPQSSLQFVSEHVPPGTPYMAINPCTSNRLRNWRNWSAEAYAELVDYAASVYGLQTVLTGGPDQLEIDYADKIVALCEQPPLNLVGKTSLKELYAVLAQARVMLAPDTGPAHMAASAGTPVIGLFASSNPHRTGPYLFQELAVNMYPQAIKAELGKDVSEVPWGTRVRNPAVMEIIKVNDVKRRLDDIIKQDARPCPR